MSNEVKEKWREFSATNPDRIIPVPHYEFWQHFLDQFEGKRLIDEKPHYTACFRCKTLLLGDGYLYHNVENSGLSVTEKLCKSCFDKVCPEPAEHKWDMSSNHPDMKRCVICGEKDVCIEAGDGSCRGLYRGVCCGDHGGNMTEWFSSRQLALDAWNSNKAPFEYIHNPNTPEPAAKPAEAEPFTISKKAVELSKLEPEEVLDILKKAKVRESEPEPWAEVIKWADGLSTNSWSSLSVYDARVGEIFEGGMKAAWHEIERRVSRMIDKAIKAERERVLAALRRAGRADCDSTVLYASDLLEDSKL